MRQPDKHASLKAAIAQSTIKSYTILARVRGKRSRDRLIHRGEWKEFHLAQNEFEARAVVQKARELSGLLAESDAREEAEAERDRRESAERQRKEKGAMLRQQSELLLAQFDYAAIGTEPLQRGFLLEDLLNRTFDLHGLSVV